MTETTMQMSRRGFLAVSGISAGACATPATMPEPVSVVKAQPLDKPVMRDVRLAVNGQIRQASLDTRTTLLDALREHLALTGSKKGCDHGQCGACTVHVDGNRVLACMTLAASVEGRQITTIEGIEQGGRLHAMQQAFIDNDAFQCGYCTSGQIMSAIACVKEGHASSDTDIREYMSGNLCRCAAYPNIVAAIRQARQAI